MKVVMTPAVVMRPIRSLPKLVNQRLPSGPVVISSGSATLPAGSAKVVMSPGVATAPFAGSSVVPRIAMAARTDLIARTYRVR
jgi:hypothetical protein